MKLRILIVFAFFLGCATYAQYGRIELNTGGFSPVPAFSDNKPNIVIGAGTNPNKRLSTHIIGNIRIEGKYLRSIIFMTQYKLIDKRLKFTVGTHLPVMQVHDDFHTDTFFAQDTSLNYGINEKSTIGLQFVHGKGVNNDLEIYLLSFSHNLRAGKFNFQTQFYGVDYEHTWGIAERINYQVSNKVYLAGFYNKGIGSSPDISTFGLGYNL